MEGCWPLSRYSMSFGSSRSTYTFSRLSLVTSGLLKQPLGWLTCLKLVCSVQHHIKVFKIIFPSLSLNYLVSPSLASVCSHTRNRFVNICTISTIFKCFFVLVKNLCYNNCSIKSLVATVWSIGELDTWLNQISLCSELNHLRALFGKFF